MPRRRRRRIQLRLNARGTRIAGIGFLLALIAISVGCVFYPQGPRANQDAFPAPLRTSTAIDRLAVMEGWVPSWSDERALVNEAADAGFHGVLLFHGSIKADGKVVLEDPKGLAVGVETARARGLASWLTVTNHGADLSATLGRNIDAHVASLLAAWRQSGCDHLDLDYESLGLADIRNLEAAITPIAQGLPGGTKLSLTLQPADSALRPDQLPVYRRLLANPAVDCLRLMAYDYHWKGSLPGALYPMAAFERLIAAYPEYRSKLVLCLPLYGYEWPRPEDCTIPQGKSIVLRDQAGIRHRTLHWMIEDAELAAFGDGTATAVPSLRAVAERVSVMLAQGVPSVSFWHLGCGRLAKVADACRNPQKRPDEEVPYTIHPGWGAWQTTFKRRVCATYTAKAGDTLESIGKQHGVERAAMYRFNEELTNDGLAGRTVFVPR